MNKKKRSSVWKIMLLSDANSPIRHLHVPKKLIITIFTLLITIITVSSFSFYSIAKVKHDNYQLKQQIVQNEKENEKLKSQQLVYEKEAQQIENKLNELIEIETELREVVTSLNPKKIENQGANYAVGGPILQIDNESDSFIENLATNTDNQVLHQYYQEINDKLPRVLLSYKETLANVEDLKIKLKKLPIVWPTNSHQVTSEFGKRNDPFTNSKSLHDGIDIAGRYKAPIYAAADGVVIASEKNDGYGNMVAIKHSSGYQTKYGHLEEIQVENGQQIKQGEIIGLMGSTGRSTGVHLHYEIIKNGKPLNPLPYMSFLK